MDAHLSERTAQLWSRFVAPLRAFVSRRAPREVDPDDVLQDVFVRIQAQLPTLRDADRIDAWIFQIARNVIADAYRQRTRREALSRRATSDDPAPQPDDDDRSAAASLAGCLASMIDQLPQPYREAIVLSEIQGMTQAQAAALVGISLSGMKSRVQRGRAQLKGIIHEFCRVDTDVRGGVIECEPLRADCGASVRLSLDIDDSTDMTDAIAPASARTHTLSEEDPSCCGGPAPKGSDACCVQDAEAKSAGEAGCGCGPKATPQSAPAKRGGCC